MLTFWYSGLNINLVRQGLADDEGWPGFPVDINLTMTRGQSEWWDTMAYWVPLVDRNGEMHNILAFAIENIIMRLN